MKKIIISLVVIIVLVLVIDMINPMILPYLGMGILTAILFKS